MFGHRPHKPWQVTKPNPFSSCSSDFGCSEGDFSCFMLQSQRPFSQTTLYFFRPIRNVQGIIISKRVSKWVPTRTDDSHPSATKFLRYGPASMFAATASTFDCLKYTRLRVKNMKYKLYYTKFMCIRIRLKLWEQVLNRFLRIVELKSRQKYIRNLNRKIVFDVWNRSSGIGIMGH